MGNYNAYVSHTPYVIIFKGEKASFTRYTSHIVSYTKKNFVKVYS